jgi:hypothetical protein
MRKIPAAELAGLIALRSVCLPGRGRLSQVLVPGRCSYDPRRVRSLVEALARHYAVDLTALRRRCQERLEMRNYLPLPISSQLVLVPLTLGREGEKTGYVNLFALEGVEEKGENCNLLLKEGTRLPCWLSGAGVRERLRRARFLLWELSAAGLLPVPGPGEIWRQKLEIIRTLLE